MSVIGGLIVLVVVLAAASVAGLGLRARSGRFRGQGSTPISDRTDRGDSPPESSRGTQLTAADLGASLGDRPTLVQFSTEFCTSSAPMASSSAARPASSADPTCSRPSAPCLARTTALEFPTE